MLIRFIIPRRTLLVCTHGVYFNRHKYIKFSGNEPIAFTSLETDVKLSCLKENKGNKRKEKRK